MTSTDATVHDSAATGGGVAAGVDPPDLAGAIEAILLTADRPVSAAKLAATLIPHEPAPRARGRKARPDDADAPPPETPGAETPESARAREKIDGAVASLNDDYEKTGRSFRVELVAGGYRVMTLSKFAPAVAAYQSGRATTALSPAALETLAVIAYRQPITRAVIEAIRGVACGEVLRSLAERGMITVAGRADELGRPLLYATTRKFLETFGLATLKDLPTIEELRQH
jgi:segregation and condensation protein B